MIQTYLDFECRYNSIKWKENNEIKKNFIEILLGIISLSHLKFGRKEQKKITCETVVPHVDILNTKQKIIKNNLFRLVSHNRRDVSMSWFFLVGKNSNGHWALTIVMQWKMQWTAKKYISDSSMPS